MKSITYRWTNKGSKGKSRRPKARDKCISVEVIRKPIPNGIPIGKRAKSKKLGNIRSGTGYLLQEFSISRWAHGPLEPRFSRKNGTNTKKFRELEKSKLLLFSYLCAEANPATNAMAKPIP